MADQVKYTNSLKDKKVLVIGGSSGKLILSRSDIRHSIDSTLQALASASQKPWSNTAATSSSPPPTQTGSRRPPSV